VGDALCAIAVEAIDDSAATASETERVRASGHGEAHLSGRAEKTQIFMEKTKDQSPSPASPPALGRHGSRHAWGMRQPPRWPVSGLAARPSSPSQMPVSGHPVAD
jgi:hypothetical protein